LTVIGAGGTHPAGSVGVVPAIVIEPAETNVGGT
jgi:hypothetical protein